MKKIFSIFCFVCLTFIVNIVNAGTTTIKFNQVGVTNIGSTTWAIILLDGNLVSVPDCATSNASQLTFPINNDWGKLTYSTALSAVMGGKDAYVVFYDDECGLNGDRPLAYRIDVKR